MIIPKETLTALREELPSGAQVRIAEKLSLSKEYVSRVLNGDASNSMQSMEVVQEAQRIIREMRELTESVNKDFSPDKKAA